MFRICTLGKAPTDFHTFTVQGVSSSQKQPHRVLSVSSLQTSSFDSNSTTWCRRRTRSSKQEVYIRVSTPSVPFGICLGTNRVTGDKAIALL